MTRLAERAGALHSCAASRRSAPQAMLADASESRGGAAPHAPPSGPYLFRKEGDFWTVRYRGDVLRLRHSKGLEYVARLLEHPGRDFLALDLVSGVAGDPATAVDCGSPARSASPALERARSAVSKRIAAEIKRIRAADPQLGRHLALTIHTGYVCSYRPPAADAVEWMF